MGRKESNQTNKPTGSSSDSFQMRPFQNDLLLKERICSQREVTLSLKEQFLKVEKLTFTALGDRLEFSILSFTCVTALLMEAKPIYLLF